MSKYRTKRMKYLISVPSAWGGSEIVTGYAIDSGLPVHIAVHKSTSGEWRFDHWETGMLFGGHSGSQKDAIAAAVKAMREALDNGKYKRALRVLRSRGLYKEINK